MAQLRKKSESKWVVWEDAKLLIRAYPGDRIKGYDDPDKALKEDIKTFMYCVEDWEGFTDDGEELECTPANKKLIYQYNFKLRKLINETMVSFFEDEEEVKN